MDNLELTSYIKEEARALGFDLVGIAPAGPFEETEARLLEHIEQGRIAGLAWFTKERATFASDPANLLPGVRSIISLGISYLQDSPDLADSGNPRGRVARYAWGQDYHEVLKAKMQALFDKIKTCTGAEEARLLVDTARIVDRAVAQRAGLGFFGKNTNLINKKLGSYFFVAEILTDLELEYDAPAHGTCGRCTRCIDACPTEAIIAPGTVYNDRCISFLTIELKGSIPPELRPGMGEWIFGCDICQEVCPYNKKATPGNHAEFAPADFEDTAPDLLGWLRLTEQEETFRQKFRGTPLSRPKRAGLRRNIAVALGNRAEPSTLPDLQEALENETDPVVREHLEWAISRLNSRQRAEGRGQ
ncbi:MAG: tRNA epoxyqueuosine(34) reductase QueG [Chloroflexi bacterium]|nr:tRNA epoxyqueuosine(34) reductase QueG [Chloroflexota bacterium]OJW04262.1 MAG: tRNA epoxyqueuosine(34) reductase QueG [Chloroflexi bacterium 54-19]